MLLTKEALAENSNCDGPNDVCCHEDDILYFYPEDKMCSAIDGYTYVFSKVFLIPMIFQIHTKGFKSERFFSYFPIILIKL